MYIVSMTYALTQFLNGSLSREDLTAPDTRFVFNCAYEHVLGHPDTAPYELTFGLDNPVKYRSSQVNLTDVPAERREAWEIFVAAVAAADADHRVWWGALRTNGDQHNPMVVLNPLSDYSGHMSGIVEQLLLNGERVFHMYEFLERDLAARGTS